ncbi:damage-inducible protein DinB [Deinococcus irradiatisoli]|uniref:Damage-inducible protein DinB n=1 Tax=Deinococcus irradiatisoli TaxID=2202254 RepID=A0A2Z3JFU9_9DEIO|nr:DinB family protein [Deinococcus irradiatisoli]AWN23892.1 damage-inducible protein DinB [Deinococcus irradiatisoli]
MRLLQTGSLPAADPKVGQALWTLNETRRRTLAMLEDGPPELDLDWRPAPEVSSAGDLLYHIAAIELDWLTSEVRQGDFPAGAAAWFPTDVRDEQGQLSRLEGEEMEQHLARLNWVRGELLATFLPTRSAPRRTDRAAAPPALHRAAILKA